MIRKAFERAIAKLQEKPNVLTRIQQQLLAQIEEGAIRVQTELSKTNQEKTMNYKLDINNIPQPVAPVEKTEAEAALESKREAMKDYADTVSTRSDTATNFFEKRGIKNIYGKHSV